MTAHKQLLHELLKESQEPFRLKSYIEDKRSHFSKSSPVTTLQVKKRKEIVPQTPTKGSNLCKHACFLTFHHSPDVRQSPYFDFHSSPSKSPAAAAVFLHVPSRTAALLVEAAMRIQKQPKSQVKSAGLGLFGSFFKILKDRGMNKKRGVGDNKLKGFRNDELKRDFDEINGDFAIRETRFCSSPVSPFSFSLHRSPPFSGRRSPKTCSPVTSSPTNRLKQKKENYATVKDTDNVQGAEEEKEQSSPVSVLDPFVEDDGHESADADEDDYDLDCSYANIQRARQQLLERLQRFEKLAQLDPLELDQKLLESSDDECQIESIESEDDEPLSLYRRQAVDTFVNQVLSQSCLQRINSSKMMMTSNMKRLATGLVVDKEVMLGRTCNRLDSWNKVEFDTVGKAIELDFEREFDGWKKFREPVEETAAEVEVAIFGLLVEEFSEELFYVDEQHQEHNYVLAECT